MSLGVYIHIPFCARKCPYCDFVSYAHEDAGSMAAYCAALVREMALWAPQRARVDSIFFGGGTPTLLGSVALARLLGAARSAFVVDEGAEITLEANPGTVDEKGLRALRRAGFNRISFGVQSFDDAVLRRLGRIHSADQAKRSIRMAQEAGFANVSLDLMFALPRQRLAGVQNDLRQALALGVPHLSCYTLKVEEGTPFFARRQGLDLPGEEEERAMAHLAHDMLTGAGYAHYEISNFALSGFRSRHNLHYWRNEHYIGLGCAAHGRVGAVRYAHADTLAAYEKDVRAGARMPRVTERLSAQEDAFETLMMGLRLDEGVDLAAIERAHGVRVTAKWLPIARRFAALGYARVEGARVTLTPAGWDVQNTLLIAFLD